jgi:protein-S-isoprenylcysteine O-methyltransferase Ste14
MIIILSILAILVVPLTAFLVIPYLFLANNLATWPQSIGGLEILALVLITIGLLLFIWVIYAHARYGKGTPAPFNPPQKFVAGGAYRLSRNPMYVGALVILVGESLLLHAPWMLVFGASLFIIFSLYLKFEEEPRLVQRFGASYQAYMKKVPRWISLKRIR